MKFIFIKDAWTLLKGFWTSSYKWKALAILAASVILNFGLVYTTVQLNYINRDLYNAIQEMNQSDFIDVIYRLGLILLPFLLVVVSRNYITSFLIFTWRQWLTKQYLDKWSINNTFYHVLSNAHHIDNPDQRIAGDIALVTQNIVEFFLLALAEIATLLSFVAILWGLSQNIPLNLFGYHLVIPGYLVWVALLYGAIGTIITVLTGKKLVLFDFNQEKYEANFRRALIQLQEKREEIALCNSINKEKSRLLETFGTIKENLMLIIKQTAYLNIVVIVYKNLAQILPMLVCAPLYFAKAINLGMLMQTAIAFGQIKDSLSIIVIKFEALASLKASLNRLIEFNRNIEDAQNKYSSKKIQVLKSDITYLQTKNLRIDKPNGEMIIDKLNLDIKQNSKLLLTGPSGSGKTTVIRALRGIWQYGEGEVHITDNSFFASQKPLIPRGILMHSINYPQDTLGAKDLLTELMQELNLGHLIDKLSKSDDWANVLSMGEQQRLIIIRAILHKPDLVIMDEPTASMDKANERKALKILFKHLKNSAFLIISHSKDAQQYFDDNIEIYTAVSEHP